MQKSHQTSGSTELVDEPVMTRDAASSDVAAVRSVLDALAQASLDRDASAIAIHYAPDAWVADLAPPLTRRGLDEAGLQAWLDGWGGPVKIASHDLDISMGGDLALVQSLQHTSTRTREGKEVAWWSRASLALARTPQGWRIVHDHVSVPFYMDGSDRAALDLEP